MLCHCFVYGDKEDHQTSREFSKVDGLAGFWLSCFEDSAFVEFRS